MNTTGHVGLVLSGGGARGAYEAGALSVLLPQLAVIGEPPTRLVGTSAGALNAVGLAGGLADGDWVAATKQLNDLWSNVQFADVAHVPSSIGKDVASYVASVLGARTELTSLLDTTPMRETLTKLLPLDAMHENIGSGVIDAVAIAATSASTGETVVFVEARPGVEVPADDDKRNIRYVRTMLTVDHVLASAAVPVAFRPVALPKPNGWYVDGGVRLNTPLKPALALGCDRLAVVATHPNAWQAEAGSGLRPDVFEGFSLLLQAVLVDHMLEDLRTLVKINTLTEQADSTDYRTVWVRFVGPPVDDPHAIAELARQTQVDIVTDRDAWLLERLVGGTDGKRAELLSFLLFHPAFTSALVALGAEHAQQAKDAAAWRTAL